MPTPAFHYQPLLELGTDDTEYRLLTKEHVRVEKIGDKELLAVDPEALTLLANKLRDGGHEALAVPCDMTVPSGETSRMRRSVK